MVPDLLFVAKSRLHIITDPNIQGPPDLTVEILSPGTARIDRGRKKTLYARFGVRYYWLVDPVARSVEVYELENAQYRLIERYQQDEIIESPLFTGLRIRLPEIWGG